MPCEKFHDAIAEAAAGRVQLQKELRSHLEGCGACSAAFAFEQSLYASIDSGVRAVANSEVPSSLLPIVRVRLRDEAIPERGRIFSWPSLVGGTLAACALVLTVAVWQSRNGREGNSISTISSEPTVALPSNRLPSTPSSAVWSSNSMKRGALRSPQSAARGENTILDEPRFEIIVPKDQELLLASYAKEMRGKSRRTLIEEDSQELEPAALQIESIQIAQLDVKPLADELSK